MKDQWGILTEGPETAGDQDLGLDRSWSTEEVGRESSYLGLRIWETLVCGFNP